MLNFLKSGKNDKMFERGFWKYDNSNKGQYTAVIIDKGRFRGVKYHYGRVEASENSKSMDKMRLKFEYTVLDNPNKRKLNQKFINTIGDILVEIMEDKMEELESVKGNLVRVPDSEFEEPKIPDVKESK